MKNKYLPILNVRISALTYPKTLQCIKSWILKRKKTYVCVAAVHLVMECQKDKSLLNGVNKAALVTPDGMPLVWLLKLYGRKNVERVYGPTLMLKVCRMTQHHGFKVYILGGAANQSKKLFEVLTKKFPKLKIVGHKDTVIRPIPPKDNKNIIKEINKSGAQIVFVGFGCPYQEWWMIKNRKQLDANVLIGVGATFDFITKRVKQAPEWMQKAGLEWLFRFFQEPKRLAYRYTTLNILFIFAIFKQLVYDFVFKRR